MIVDLPFLLASASFGFGLSLAVYRWLAVYNDWPMGHLHANRPALPVSLGILCMLVALAFAAARGAQYGGWGIVVFGLLWALFWLGFFRVGSQLSLLLAPVATAMLLFSWFGSPTFFHSELIRGTSGERVLVFPKSDRDTGGERRYEEPRAGTDSWRREEAPGPEWKRD
jgi:hypothetical protein